MTECPLKRELLAFVDAAEHPRRLAASGLLLEHLEQRGANSLTPMRREHREVDELRMVGTGRGPLADVTGGGERAIRRVHAHAQTRRILHQVLPVAPFSGAALLHPVVLAVAYGDELVAVGVGEVPRAVARRQAGAQAEDVGDRHGAHDERRPVRASTT